MRKYAVLLSSLVSMLLLSVGTGAAQASCTDLLCVGGPGGTNVANTDTLSAGLSSGTAANFTSGFVTISCSVASFSATATNAVRPGSASLTLSGLRFTGCKSGSNTVTTTTNHSGTATFSDSGNISNVTISGQDVSFTVSGNKCDYAVPSRDTGNWTVGGSAVAVSSIPVNLTGSGNSFLCSSTGSETVAFVIVDVTQGNGIVTLE